MNETVKKFDNAIQLIDAVRLILVTIRDAYVALAKENKPATKEGGNNAA